MSVSPITFNLQMDNFRVFFGDQNLAMIMNLLELNLEKFTSVPKSQARLFWRISDGILGGTNRALRS